MSYQDVFTGYIFYKPIRDHVLIEGIPGIARDGFGATLVQRYRISGFPVLEGYEAQFAADRERLHESGYENLPVLEAQIEKWLKPDTD